MNNTPVWKLAMLIVQVIAILIGIGVGIWVFGSVSG